MERANRSGAKKERSTQRAFVFDNTRASHSLSLGNGQRTPSRIGNS